MRSNRYHVLFVSAIMILSSLAGCLGTDDDASDDSDSLGTVMVSTYHIGELVKGIAGDQVTMEYMSLDNIPVHDYEPSASDLIRLQNADVFFYHGLGLEPWVESTLSSLGSDAPTSIEVHTMPAGQSTLDYEGVLVTDLCETLTEGPFEDVLLVDEQGHAGDVEIHAEYTAFNISFPHEDHDDHDGHDDHDDHDGHDDHDDHDGHDEHEGHAHAEPEETITNPAGCPADSVISIFELEEGEYVLEFDAEHPEDFTMAVLKMGGGHAHHHHHGDGPFEWAGIFAVSDDSHTWTMAKVGGKYADPMMRVVIIPTDSPVEATMHSLESGVEALIEGDCPVVEDGGTMTPIAAGGSCFELTVKQSSDVSSFNLDTSGMAGFAAYTAHSPYEFEADAHYLKDSTGANVEHVAEEGGGGHGAHEGHGAHGDEHGVCHDMSDHTNNNIDNKADCEAGGFMWMEEDGHSTHDGDYCHDTISHQNTNHTTEADCEAAGHMWMESGHHDEEMTPERALEQHDTNNDSHISWDEFWAGWNEEHHHGHEGHHEEHHNVAVLYPGNSMEMYEAEHDALPENATGWNLTHAALVGDGNLTLNYSVHSTYGTSLVGINGTDAPTDSSWWWQLMLWNTTSSPPAWEPSEHGIDSVMIGENYSNVANSGSSVTEHIAWAANNSNHSLLPSPAMHDEHDDDEHDEHEEEMLMDIFNESDTNNDGLLNLSELGHFVEEVNEFEDRIPTPEEALEHHDANNDSHISWDEFWTAWTTEGYGGDHDDHDGHDGHSGHENNATHNTTTNETHDDHDEHQEEMLMDFFNESDMDSNGLLNMSELGHFIEDVEKWLNPPLGFVTIHVEAEGDYGFLMPADVGFHVLMGEDGHSDHAGHGDHGDEDGDHGDEDGDHGADGDNHSAEETLNYDPHSWLSPLAFKAQVNVVLNGLTTAFPAGEDDFNANAETYSGLLTDLDTAFDAAFGANGVCTTGGHSKTVAANHNAYSYIAVEYDIQFMTVHGLDPEGEPSPEDVAKVVNFIKEEGITVLFVEEYTDQSSVQSIVDETGVTIKILYTMEMAPSDSSDNYMTMMTKNLENLISGMGC